MIRAPLAGLVALAFNLPAVDADGGQLRDLAHLWVCETRCGITRTLSDYDIRRFPPGAGVVVYVPADSAAVVYLVTTDTSGNVSAPSSRVVPWPEVKP